MILYFYFLRSIRHWYTCMFSNPLDHEASASYRLSLTIHGVDTVRTFASLFRTVCTSNKSSDINQNGIEIHIYCYTLWTIMETEPRKIFLVANSEQMLPQKPDSYKEHLCSLSSAAQQNVTAFPATALSHRIANPRVDTTLTKLSSPCWASAPSPRASRKGFHTFSSVQPYRSPRCDKTLAILLARNGGWSRLPRALCCTYTPVIPLFPPSITLSHTNPAGS